MPWRRLGPFLILECPECKHQWCFPMPTEEDLSTYYADGHHPSAIDDSINFVERRVIIKTIMSLRPHARTFLDIGCGFGHYLTLISELGLNCLGVEPDEVRAKVAIKRGYNVLNCFFDPDVLHGRTFDIVMLSHIIEHAPSPDQLLRKVHQALNPNGLIVIACPNHAGLRARICKLHFDPYAPPEHVAYFNPSSLTMLCQRVGFECILLHTFVNPLQVKMLLAHLIYLRFLQKVRYCSPREDSTPVRFIDRKGRFIREKIYAFILASSRSLAPLVNTLGGDHIHGYFSPISHVPRPYLRNGQI